MNHLLYVLVGALFFSFSSMATVAQLRCSPTPPDAEGPFYKADAPIRERTGRGLTISGSVRSAGDCPPIPAARVEWWQANLEGRYDDEHRGALLTASDGSYRFETSFPPAYYGRPPHIHLKILAPGHKTLTTQLYPAKGQNIIVLDLVLIRD